MSSWTVLTLRGKKARDYVYTRRDDSDRWDAESDLVATLEAGPGVRKWTSCRGGICAYLQTDSWEAAENLIQDHAEMIDDAVVLRANDTTDTGTARYYGGESNPTYWTDHYQETQSEDGVPLGQIALGVMAARHGILARDPFHTWTGRLDEDYLESGRAYPGDDA